MKLIAIIVALSLERAFDHLEYLREPHWFHRYGVWLRERFGERPLLDGPTGVLAILAPVVIAVVLVQWILGFILFGLPGFLFAIFVLLYCLGPRQLDVQVEAFTAAVRAGDEDAARGHARDILGEDVPADADLGSVVADAVLVRANERLFAVIFWFMILGGVGAALYRATWALKVQLADHDHGLAVAARRLQGLLDWIPARGVALAYALTGRFEEAVHGWQSYREQWSDRLEDSSIGILICTGNGALGLPVDAAARGGGGLATESVEGAMGLVWRTLIVWVTVIALITLAGWVI